MTQDDRFVAAVATANRQPFIEHAREVAAVLCEYVVSKTLDSRGDGARLIFDGFTKLVAN